MRPFHLAFPVKDLEATRKFYCDILGCTTGRSDETWIDFDFFGHQISAHLSPASIPTRSYNVVDSHQIPVNHWGVILNMQDWEALADRLRGQVEFIIEPYVRFKGEVGEQATMFFLDPSGNALEFKAFADDRSIFAT